MLAVIMTFLYKLRRWHNYGDPHQTSMSISGACGTYGSTVGDCDGTSSVTVRGAFAGKGPIRSVHGRIQLDPEAKNLNHQVDQSQNFFVS
jgi:hypothetical protein